MTESDKVKIPVKLDVSVRLAGADFRNAGRAYVIDWDGSVPPPDDVCVEDIAHRYGADFLVEVPKELMDRLNARTFFEIKVEGELDHITDDATEDIRIIAYKRDVEKKNDD